jgi:hypothetical protein
MKKESNVKDAGGDGKAMISNPLMRVVVSPSSGSSSQTWATQAASPVYWDHVMSGTPLPPKSGSTSYQHQTRSALAGFSVVF